MGIVAKLRRATLLLITDLMTELVTDDSNTKDDSSHKVALVTAAGSGVGAEIARVLAARGYRLGILSPSGRGEALARELGGVGVTGSNLVTGDLEHLVAMTIDRYGRLDAVVNSAGHGPRGDLLELTDADWLQGAEVYFLSVVRICRLVTPHLLAAGGGAVVNVSSFSAFEPDPAFPTSSAFRASLASFTKLYADRYAPHNIRINNILPGFIDSFPKDEAVRRRIPLGRYGSVREIAETAAFLLSEGGAYLTGQNLRVDGGLTRSV